MVSAPNVLRDEPLEGYGSPATHLGRRSHAIRWSMPQASGASLPGGSDRHRWQIACRDCTKNQARCVIVADIGMPLMNGLEAGLRVKQKMPNVKLVFLTMHDDPGLAVKAMRSGAFGYLLKASGASELIKAIQMALECKRYVTPLIAWRIEKSFIEDSPVLGLSKVLTARQREVLELLCSGKTMKEAASILNVSARTIGFHKYRVMSRFNLRSNAELIRFAASQQAIIV